MLVDCIPHQGKTLVKSKFFPHLKPFLSAKRPTLDKAMDPAVGEPIVVTRVVEAMESSSDVECKKQVARLLQTFVRHVREIPSQIRLP